MELAKDATGKATALKHDSLKAANNAAEKANAANDKAQAAAEKVKKLEDSDYEESGSGSESDSDDSDSDDDSDGSGSSGVSEASGSESAHPGRSASEQPRAAVSSAQRRQCEKTCVFASACFIIV